MLPRHHVEVQLVDSLFPAHIHRGWAKYKYCLPETVYSLAFNIRIQELAKDEDVMVVLLHPKYSPLQKALPIDVIRKIWDMLYT